MTITGLKTSNFPQPKSPLLSSLTSTHSLFSLCCKKRLFRYKEESTELSTTGKSRVELNRGFSFDISTFLSNTVP